MSDPSRPDGAAGWRLDLSIPAAALGLVEQALEPLGGALVVDGPNSSGEMGLTLYLAEHPDQAEVTALLAAAALVAGRSAFEYRLAALPPTDWVAESQKALPPIRAGRFYIYGSHVADPPPAAALALEIEANEAFGTGRHESTRGCLLALQSLHRAGFPVTRALDMGCGSGVLAMAIARLWHAPVLAVDNDRPSVRVARENARRNRLAAWIRPIFGEGYSGLAVARAAPFDLIVANILAGPLSAMAADLQRHLAPGGTAVLSGLLSSQEAQVLAKHRPLGLHLVRRFRLDGWSTLVLRRRA